MIDPVLHDEPLISFCIPTYNRASLLEAGLKVLVEDKGDLPVEIIVSDNCSTDGTAEVLAEYSRRHGIRYGRNSENLGAVRNLLKAMQAAKGTYLWILSDDDQIVPGIIPYVANLLRKEGDLAYLFVPRMLVEVDLTSSDNRIQPQKMDMDALFDDGREIFMSYQGGMCEVMGFLSSTILRRNIWEDVYKMYKGPVDNWILMNVILHILPGRRCGIAGRLGILARVGNSPAGLDSRIWLDEYIGVFLNALSLNYSPEFCKSKIHSLFRQNAMKFVLNKAEGSRDGNIFSVGKAKGVEKLVDRGSLWYYLSYLPGELLRPLLWLRSGKRAIRRYPGVAALLT